MYDCYQVRAAVPGITRPSSSMRSLKIILLLVLLTLTSIFYIQWCTNSTFARPEQIILPHDFLARTTNGTYRGAYLSNLGQLAFLGMPYASAPLNLQRFRRPRSHDVSWDGVREATTYGPHCIGYGDRQNYFRSSEDCLSINVIRPAHRLGDALPVAVYIYGGGDAGGGSSDERYNLSFIVSHASQVGLDFIGVSFNYRSTLFGYISGEEVQRAEQTNIGLYDQRMALNWVQENIGAFGGDPGKVTIWGGSSGAADVGLHLTAYGGRDEGLFRAAIMQSGGPITVNRLTSMDGQGMFQQLVEQVGCDGPDGSLPCLRQLSFDHLNAAFNRSRNDGMMTRFSFPVVDGQIIPGLGSDLVLNSAFVTVPIITGVVGNEGSVYTEGAIATWSDAYTHLVEYLQFPPSVANELISMYRRPSGPKNPPADERSTAVSTKTGIQSMFGDLWENASNRVTCRQYSKVSRCYNFLFDAIPPWSLNRDLGAQHGAEISAVFQNVDGVHLAEETSVGGDSSYSNLARMMGTMWAGFISEMDPNIGFDSELWRRYQIGPGAEEHIVFDTTRAAIMETGDQRSEALEYIATIMPGVLGV